MTNEIKEILDNPKILMLSYGNYISLNDYVKLKDYITNLQQTLDETVDSYTEEYNLRKELDLKLYILQEENERLKEWKEDLLNENIELENIRKEAIEKIESVQIIGLRSGKTLISTLLNEVEDILEGADK